MPLLEWDGEWAEAFGRPFLYERWFIDGDSGSGKSTFVMKLAKKLCDYGRVDYIALEEGMRGSFKERVKAHRMSDVKGKFMALPAISIDELAERLAVRKSAKFVIIDSVQYTGATFRQIKTKLLDRFPRKCFIFVSQTWRGKPKGKTANDLLYDAGVKISTKGYRAICYGRYNPAPGSYYTIWDEGANQYWLN